MNQSEVLREFSDAPKVTFSFGKNWEEFFSKNFSEERVAISRKHILNFLGVQDLKGRSFLDIGCGSGLSSLAAYDAGAQSVTSFDLDEHSVATTRKAREMRGNPDNWKVLSGSILDPAFISTLPKADIVYSWGVLHHTGQMWQAISNAMDLMNDQATLYIALYIKDRKSDYWLKKKMKYNSSSALGKKIMELCYVLRYPILESVVALKNPMHKFIDYKNNRGMSYMTDVRDWLGGYPYEFARVEEVFHFVRKKMDLELINISSGEANVEYLFRK